MNKNIDILESLITTKKEKKKKNPSPQEKEEFRSAWVNLAVDAGYTSRVEQFLYDGFGFCGAEPFYAYLLQTEDPNAALTTMFNGHCYGLDSNATFRVITHLLAVMINNNAPRNLVAPVIKRLPGACINKDKMRLGTAEKTMEKYFFAVIRPDVVLCPLADIGTKPVYITEFMETVTSVMTGIENDGFSKGVVAENIKKVRDWFGAYDNHQLTAKETGKKHVEGAFVPETKSDSDDKKQTVIHIQENTPVTQKKRPDSHVDAQKQTDEVTSDIMDLLGKVGKAAVAIRAESIQQKGRIAKLTQALESEQETLRHANQQIAVLQNTIVELRQKLSSAEGDIFVLKQTIEQKNTELVEKNTEIVDRIKMADVLSRDRSKQADETLQRLASKIRVEYRDFADALDVPMSCDLGENLRLQLQSVFEILEKGGMKIK